VDEKIRAALVAEETDACRFLLLALVSMLRTSKSGILRDQLVRSVLADRLEKALIVKAEGVSDALGITRNRSASSVYGNCKYDFMLWYWGYMERQTKPKGVEVEAWLKEYPGGSPSTGSTVNGWIAEAKLIHSDVLAGARIIDVFTSS